MTMLESQARETPAEIRRRLFAPAGGHLSSELDIIAEPVARRLRAEQEAIQREQDQQAREETRRRDIADAKSALNAKMEAMAAETLQVSRQREIRIIELVDLIKGSEAELRTLCAESVRDQPRDFSFAGKFSQILDVVSKFYFVHNIHILSRQQTARIARPRQIIMFLACELTGMSLAQIGSRLGGRDHTTILSGRRKIERILADGDPTLATELAEIKRRLGAG